MVENFHVSKEAFLYLCHKLGPLISHPNIQQQKYLSVEKHFAITLVTCSEYCTLAHLFGLACSTICVTVHDTCKANVSALQKLFIKFPDGDEHKEVIEGFKSTWGMIHCVGSIDRVTFLLWHLHQTIPTITIERGGIVSFCKLLLTADIYFKDICVGCPGIVHDTRV